MIGASPNTSGGLTLAAPCVGCGGGSRAFLSHSSWMSAGPAGSGSTCTGCGCQGCGNPAPSGVCRGGPGQNAGSVPGPGAPYLLYVSVIYSKDNQNLSGPVVKCLETGASMASSCSDAPHFYFDQAGTYHFVSSGGPSTDCYDHTFHNVGSGSISWDVEYPFYAIGITLDD